MMTVMPMEAAPPARAMSVLLLSAALMKIVRMGSVWMEHVWTALWMMTVMPMGVVTHVSAMSVLLQNVAPMMTVRWGSTA